MYSNKLETEPKPNNTESGMWRFYCECGKSYSRKRDVNRHKRIHHNDFGRETEENASDTGHEWRQRIEERFPTKATADKISSQIMATEKVKSFYIDVAYVDCWYCHRHVKNNEFRLHFANHRKSPSEVALKEESMDVMDQILPDITDEPFETATEFIKTDNKEISGTTTNTGTKLSVQLNPYRDIPKDAIPSVEFEVSVPSEDRDEVIFWSEYSDSGHSIKRRPTTPEFVVEASGTLSDNQSPDKQVSDLRHYCDVSYCNRSYSRARDVRRHKKQHHGIVDEVDEKQQHPSNGCDQQHNPNVNHQPLKLPSTIGPHDYFRLDKTLHPWNDDVLEEVEKIMSDSERQSIPKKSIRKLISEVHRMRHLCSQKNITIIEQQRRIDEIEHAFSRVQKQNFLPNPL